MKHAFLRELGVLPQGIAAFLSRLTVDDLSVGREAFVSLLEAAPDAMLIVDAEGRIVTINAHLETVFGYRRDELLGRPIELLVPTRVREVHVQHRTAYFKAPVPRPMDAGLTLYGQRKDGTEFPVEISLNPIQTARGPVVIAAVRDVTERKRTEEALRKARSALEQRVAERTAELRAANETLQHEVAERRRLEHELLAISEIERRRIGEDLHDGLGQDLLGIALKGQTLEQQLAAKSPSEARRIGELVQQVYQAIGETRELSRGLCPGDLSAGGLVSALAQLASRTEQSSGVACAFASDPAAAVADETVAIQLYRIAQEALNNAIKHSTAKQVEVALTATDGRLTLTVKDNGVGLPKDLHASTGLGLRIMRHRARMIGALFDIRQASDHGTEVVCVVPMPSNAEIGP